MANAASSSHCAAIDTGFVAIGPVKVAFFGVVQGITELLPVSSTAHIRAIPAFLRWPDPGSAFSAAMQLVALLAVIAYFRSDLWAMIRVTFASVRSRDFRVPDFRLGVGTLLATVPIAIVGAALSGILNQCQSPLRQPILIGAVSLTVAVMGAAEYFARHKRPSAQFGYRDALLVGLAQVGALIPGVSRSWVTLTASLALGFRREDAARVSFLLGVPAITLAGFHELWKLHEFGLSPRG